MVSYTRVGKGTPIYPATVSYAAFTITTSSMPLCWSFYSVADVQPTAAVMDVTVAEGLTGTISLILPPANIASIGQQFLINNRGKRSFNLVTHQSKTSVITIDTADGYYVYLTDNSTEDGKWQQTKFGAGTSDVQAETLEGAGIISLAENGTNGTLNFNVKVKKITSDYTVAVEDRATLLTYTNNGSITVFLPSDRSLPAGFTVFVNNSGGIVQLAPTTPLGMLNQYFNSDVPLSLSSGSALQLVYAGTDFAEGSGQWFTVGTNQQLLFPNGSVSSPSITFANDSNSGLSYNNQPSKKVIMSVDATEVSSWTTTGTNFFLTPNSDKTWTRNGVNIFSLMKAFT